MNGAIVELDSLPDAYGAASNNDRLRRRNRLRLVLLFIGAVEVRRLRLELSRARIHHLVDRPDVPTPPQGAHLLMSPVGQHPNPIVAEAKPLGLPEEVSRQRLAEETRLHLNDVLERAGKPRVDARNARQRLRRNAPPQREQQRPEPLVIGMKR